MGRNLEGYSPFKRLVLAALLTAAGVTSGLNAKDHSISAQAAEDFSKTTPKIEENINQPHGISIPGVMVNRGSYQIPKDIWGGNLPDPTNGEARIPETGPAVILTPPSGR